MAKWSFLFLCFFQGLLPLIFGQQQQRTSGPWRHRIQWESNGQVYSLMSTGSEYHSPVRSRSHSRVYVSSRTDGTRGQMPGAHRVAALVRPGQGESRQFGSDHGAEPGSFTPRRDARQSVPGDARAPGAMQQRERPRGAGAARRFNAEHANSICASATGSFADLPGRRAAVGVDATAPRTRGGEPGPGAQYQQLRAVPQAASDSRQPAQTDRSISTYPATPALREDAANEATTNGEDMVNDDPRNPLKNHRNSVFYNMQPTRGRSGARTLRPPGTGYGTSFFQNGRFSVLILLNEFNLVN